MSLLSSLGIGDPFASPHTTSTKAQQAKASQLATQKSLKDAHITVPARSSDFPDGFEIYEIVNGIIPSSPTVSLIENRMPKVPFEYGGEQRIVKDFYPGSSEPVMHILGPKETDVVLSGRLYDKKFKSSKDASGHEINYGASYALASVLDGIRLRGNLCKFTMGPWVRYGFLEKTQFPLKRLGDIEYHITLNLSGFNLPQNAHFTDPKQNPIAKNDELFALTQAHKLAYTFGADLTPLQKQISSQAPKTIIDELNTAVSDVATQIAKVTGFVDDVFKAGENILKVANRALGLIKNAQRALSQYKRQLSTIQKGFQTLTPLNKPPSSIASSRASVSNFILNQHSSAKVLTASMFALQKNIEAISKTVPIGRVRVQAGDTLQKIASKNYGNAAVWTNIYDHNNLTTSVLTPGQVLELPRVT